MNCDRRERHTYTYMRHATEASIGVRVKIDSTTLRIKVPLNIMQIGTRLALFESAESTVNHSSLYTATHTRIVMRRSDPSWHVTLSYSDSDLADTNGSVNVSAEAEWIGDGPITTDALNWACDHLRRLTFDVFDDAPRCWPDMETMSRAEHDERSQSKNPIELVAYSPKLDGEMRLVFVSKRGVAYVMMRAGGMQMCEILDERAQSEHASDAWFMCESMEGGTCYVIAQLSPFRCMWPSLDGSLGPLNQKPVFATMSGAMQWCDRSLARVDGIVALKAGSEWDCIRIKLDLTCDVMWDPSGLCERTSAGTLVPPQCQAAINVGSYDQLEQHEMWEIRLMDGLAVRERLDRDEPNSMRTMDRLIRMMPPEADERVLMARQPTASISIDDACKMLVIDTEATVNIDLDSIHQKISIIVLWRSIARALHWHKKLSEWGKRVSPRQCATDRLRSGNRFAMIRHASAEERHDLAHMLIARLGISEEEASINIL